jgi:hypothetical protein
MERPKKTFKGRTIESVDKIFYSSVEIDDFHSGDKVNLFFCKICRNNFNFSIRDLEHFL